MNRRELVKFLVGIAALTAFPFSWAFGKAKARVSAGKLKLRKSSDRGFADHGWLKTRHSFSFADYYDPAFMGFANLRVINQDIVTALAGFPTHPHKDMEIVTYVLSGEVKHKDTLGNTAVIKRGEIQKMTAGTGIQHSEYNNSSLMNVHFLQIWMEPSAKNLAPFYEQKPIENFGAKGLICVASEGGQRGGLSLKAEVDLYRGTATEKTTLEFKPKRTGHVWIQTISGELKAGGFSAKEGDALYGSDITRLALAVTPGTEFLLFDLKG